MLLLADAAAMIMLLRARCYYAIVHNAMFHVLLFFATDVAAYAAY